MGSFSCAWKPFFAGINFYSFSMGPSSIATYIVADFWQLICQILTTSREFFLVLSTNWKLIHFVKKKIQTEFELQEPILGIY